ncbi:Gp19/Gp15/Gp42 family protein [Curtobacterium sp. VKM Ac-1376]|uniref:Gp19/Gp15/Gp42 family protein n=1 Tax=Curtobacterium sp. VKM Ac-1376 TaxID=123312 RepID=UPI00188B481D|nr:hypothetical protein [Curtobacterium sp. VKM Ac-1376]
MAWTSADDVLDAWIGSDAPTDVDRVTNWVARAEREIRFRVPHLQARIDAEAELGASTDLLDTARDVVVAMVTRVFRNPEGVRQRNTTTGPFTESATYGGDVPGGLGLTDDELAKLQGTRSRGAFTIDMIPSTSPFSAPYVPLGSQL